MNSIPKTAVEAPATIGCHFMEPLSPWNVAHQHVFGLLIVIKHHLVSPPADARLLVAAKRRMRGIGPQGEFLIGDNDVNPGEIGAPFSKKLGFF
jgi:hypothetical protein